MNRPKAPPSPVEPPVREIPDIAAIQALERGTATEDQQKRALRWIIYEVAKTYDLSYRPGDQSQTDFAEGKRFVGLEIISTLKINLTKLREQEERKNVKTRKTIRKKV